MGNAITNNHVITGSVNITGSQLSVGGISSNWVYPGLNAIQVNTATIYGYTATAGFASNVNYNSSFRYITNGGGGYIENSGGNWSFLTAPEGIAGNAATLTTKMFISSSGNIGINNATPAYTLDVTGTGRFTGALNTGGKLTAYNPASATTLLVYGGNSVDPRTNDAAGEIRIGNNASYYGNIAFSNGGQSTLSIDNSYDNAAASMVFRMRTLGTPINALTILGTGAATFSSALSATAGTFSSTLKSTGGDLRSIGTAADAVATGPYVTISDTSTSKQMLHQLNASFGEDIWSFNGTAWTKVYTLTAAGTATITGAPSLGNAHVICLSNSSGNTSYGGLEVQSSTGKAGYLTVGDNSNTGWYGAQASYVTLAGTAGAGMKFRVNADDTTGITIPTSGYVGIGTTAPSCYLQVIGGSNTAGFINRSASSNSNVQLGNNSTDNGTGIALFGSSFTTSGQYRASGGYFYSNQSGGITIHSEAASTTIYLAINNSTRMTIDGSGTTVAGSLSKGSGTFKIDHPLESKKETNYLVHSFVEGPRADLIYRGKVTLVNGTAVINIDETVGMTAGTFVALNRDVQCFTTNESGWDLVKGKVEGNILTIISQNSESTDEISWMVVGERQDEHIKNTNWTDENGKPILEPLKTT
jgi:hypothetical protein